MSEKKARVEDVEGITSEDGGSIRDLPAETCRLIIAVIMRRDNDLKTIANESFEDFKTEESKNKLYSITHHFSLTSLQFLDKIYPLDWVRVVEGHCSVKVALFAYFNKKVSISTLLGDFKINKGSNWKRGFEILQSGKRPEGDVATEIAVYLMRCVVCKTLDSDTLTATVDLMMNLYVALEGRSDLKVDSQDDDMKDILKAISSSDIASYLSIVKKLRDK